MTEINKLNMNKNKLKLLKGKIPKPCACPVVGLWIVICFVRSCNL